MGLDMYLYRVPKVDSIQELKELNDQINTLNEQGIGNTLNTIANEKGFIYPVNVHFDKYTKKWALGSSRSDCYWRKFNALHNWFVQNIQNGVDKCEEHLLSEDKVKELLELLESLIPENCQEKLPTKSGFFFGTDDYDEYYWKDVKDTIVMMKYLLLSVDFREESLVYCSSW